MRVLIVEDADALRGLFARVIRRHGFDVCEACDGLEAIDCLIRFDPDLVLTDLMMPGLDGLGLLRRLRETPGLERIPVVIMTAAPTPETEMAVFRAGEAYLLAKPIDLADLIGYLARYRGGG